MAHAVPHSSLAVDPWGHRRDSTQHRRRARTGPPRGAAGRSRPAVRETSTMNDDDLEVVDLVSEDEFAPRRTSTRDTEIKPRSPRRTVLIALAVALALVVAVVAQRSRDEATRRSNNSPPTSAPAAIPSPPSLR